MGYKKYFVKKLNHEDFEQIISLGLIESETIEHLISIKEELINDIKENENYIYLFNNEFNSIFMFNDYKMFINNGKEIKDISHFIHIFLSVKFTDEYLNSYIKEKMEKVSKDDSCLTIESYEYLCGINSNQEERKK